MSRDTLHVRVPPATPSRGGSFILRNPKKERTNTIIFHVSQLEMVFASVLLFSKVFMNCMNNIGVFSKNCLMCSRRFHHTCRGVLRTEVHSDLAFAIAKTIPSFVITSDVQSLRWALGNCAGNLGMARGRAYRSIPW